MTTKINLFSHHNDLQSYSVHKDHVHETVSVGGILGELTLIDYDARSATAIAKTNCKLAEVNEERFHFLVQQTPYFATQMMRVLVERIRRLDEAEIDYLQ